MMIPEARLDQICFLLMFLRRCIASVTKGWWRMRAKCIAKALKKNRPGKLPWHVEYAEKTLKGVKRIEEEAGERWERRESLQLSRDHYELGKMKGE